MLRIDLNLLFTVINLIVLFLLLRHFLVKPVMGIIEKREALIQGQLDSASQAQQKADELKSQYEAVLAGADGEADQIVARARDKAKAEEKRIIEKANQEAGKIMKEAKTTIELEREQEMKKLQNQVAGLALSAVEKVLSEQLGEQQSSSLYDQFLKETGGTYDTDRA